MSWSLSSRSGHVAPLADEVGTVTEPRGHRQTSAGFVPRLQGGGLRQGLCLHRGLGMRGLNRPTKTGTWTRSTPAVKVEHSLSVAVSLLGSSPHQPVGGGGGCRPEDGPLQPSASIPLLGQHPSFLGAIPSSLSMKTRWCLPLLPPPGSRPCPLALDKQSHRAGCGVL